jgi:PAS domain S-box-containing protein
MNEQLKNLRPRRRFWVMAFVAASVLIAAIGALQYRVDVRRITHEQSEMLKSVGALKEQQIAVWRSDRLGDALRFAQGPSLVTAVRQIFQEANKAIGQSNGLAMLRLNCKGAFYQNAIIASTSGDVLLAASMPLTPLPETTLRAIRTAVATQSPTFSDIYQSCSKRQVHIDTVAPIAIDDTNAVSALLILRSDANTFLYPLIKFWPTDSASAETMLVKREGDEVCFLNDVRHCTNTALRLRTPLTQRENPAVRAALGFRGICEGTDYRGVDVLADIRAIPNSNWFLVSQMDFSEIQDETRYRAVAIARIAGLCILLVAALIATGYRRRQSRLYSSLYKAEREQRESHEKFETILYSIGDGVIVTDAQARVCQMNAAAEHLAGWSEAEARGKPLGDVFRIVQAETRAPAENPVDRVFREGKVAGLANHTVLIARDGTERLIADCAAPVRDAHGTMTGVVLVFRDQTAEYAAQKALRESEAQYSDLFNNMTEGFSLLEFIFDAQGKPSDFRFLKANPALERLLDRPSSQITGHRLLELFPAADRQWIDAYGSVAQNGRPVCVEMYSHLLKRHFQVTAFRPRAGMLGTFLTDITDRKKSEEERTAFERQLQQSQRIEAVGRLAGGVAHDFNNMLAVMVGTAEVARDRVDADAAVSADLQEIIAAGKRSAELVKQLLAFARRQTIMPRVLNLNPLIAGMMTMLKRLIGEEISLVWIPAVDLWNVKVDPSQIDQILVNLTINARDAIDGRGTIRIQTANATLSADDVQTMQETAPGQFVQISVSDDGCGMDEETQLHIFEPFFTTKQNEVGSGLGLSTVYGIVKQNGGVIRLSSRPNDGTRLDIFLPRHTSTPPPPPIEKETETVRPIKTATILLVEDEPALLSLTEALIKSLGYNAIAAASAEDAIKRANEFVGDIDLLMTDVVMPDLSGHDLWKRLIERRPHLRSLYISGYTADIIAHHGVIETDIHFLQKPFSRDSLAAKLREILS